jgi:hypothetical protein
MKGVRYLFDNKGEPEMVIIEVKKNPELWEDIHDILVARERVKEPRIPWEEVKAKLQKSGKIK